MALVDNAISLLNASLAANLSWLTNTFGAVETRVKKDPQGRDQFYPGTFLSNTDKDYRNLLPDSKLGNYCYFEVEDGGEYKVWGSMIQTPFRCKIVFWFYWPDLYPADWRTRSLEEVKAQILNVLKNTPPATSVKVFNIWEDADNIYRGFDHHEIDRQFLMRPYGGLAIECEVTPQQECADDIAAPVIPPNVYGSIPATYSTLEQVWPYQKWIGGIPIYWITYQIGNGTGDYVTLTGLANGYTRVRSEYRSLVGGVPQEKAAELEYGITDYKVLTMAFETEISLTVYYIK